MGAPTNQKDGLWGQWWAKLPWVLEWQGQTGGSKCGAIWPEMEVGTVGRIVLCIPNQSILHDFISQNIWRNISIGNTEE